MRHRYLPACKYLVTLLLGVPLVILAVKAVGLWGLVAGLMMGAAITWRMLLRDIERVEPAPCIAQVVLIIAPEQL